MARTSVTLRAPSLTDIQCNTVQDRRGALTELGCSTTTSVAQRTDTREAARVDFEWVLGDHQLRFGLDHETNTSDHSQFYPGPDKLLYEIFTTTPGATVNNATIPAGVTAYVRTRRNEVSGEFETINTRLLSRGQLVGHTEPGPECRRSPRGVR